MKVFIDQRGFDCAENTTLAQFLQLQQIDTAHIAVAIDDAVVFRKNWETTTLADGCNILIIKATQGG